MESKESPENLGKDATLWQRFIFHAARIVAFFYRLNTLRLAGAIFSKVSAPTILSRRFFECNLVLDVSRANPQKLLWLQGERFVQERALLRSVVQPGMTIVDVGANIGYITLMFSSFLRRSGRIVCIEPDSTNLLELRANIASNKLDGLVTIFPAAAGDFDGNVRFEPGLNSHIVPDGDSEVPIKKIDSLLLGNVDFIKIDVEGYEGAVLDGARQTIEQNRPTLFLELHARLLTKHTHSEIVRFLQHYYPKMTAYQMEPQNRGMKVLQSYGLAKQFSITKDVLRMAEQYEAGCFLEPCWLLAQAR